MAFSLQQRPSIYGRTEHAHGPGWNHPSIRDTITLSRGATRHKPISLPYRFTTTDQPPHAHTAARARGAPPLSRTAAANPPLPRPGDAVPEPARSPTAP